MEQVNNAFKTIVNRLNSFEDTENNQKSKVIQVLESHNVFVYKDNGEFRNFYDVLTDISSIWNELSNDEKKLLNDIEPYVKDKS